MGKTVYTIQLQPTYMGTNMYEYEHFVKEFKKQNKIVSMFVFPSVVDLFVYKSYYYGINYIMWMNINLYYYKDTIFCCSTVDTHIAVVIYYTNVPHWNFMHRNRNLQLFIIVVVVKPKKVIKVIFVSQVLFLSCNSIQLSIFVLLWFWVKMLWLNEPFAMAFTH